MDKRINLYQDTAPGSENLKIKEIEYDEIEEKSGQQNKYIQKVLMPSLTPFIPDVPKGPCIIVIPGGGYRRQVLTKEGLRVAAWLNSLGIAAFVLRHRMPGDGHECGPLVPLQDAQRSLRLVRSLADHYGYDSDKIGVMGFSAGGHVAASVSTSYNKRVYTPRDSIDLLSARPDFSALIYPVISLHSYDILGKNLPEHAAEHEDILETFPADRLITENTPQTFIAGADDDITTPSENCVNYYLGLRRAGVSAELHLFRKGEHGFGLGIDRGNVSQWPKMFESWLELVEFHKTSQAR